ncbi:MAG: Gldg family protein [Planctomycetota bacterium]|jgi:gliding-associated putative ABC transporter substrate-binding component GldG
MAGSKNPIGRFTRWFIAQVGLQSVLVIAIVWFGFLLMEGVFVRLDLTQDKRFTISDASHRIASKLADPLTIRVYMSNEIPPRIEPLQRQVLDIVQEYEASSSGKIKVERYDPDQSSTARNEAKNYNLAPVPVQVYGETSVSQVQIYGGLVLVYQDRSSEVINFAARYGQGYEGLSSLEYEISSRIWQLSNEKPKLGLTGSLMSKPAMPMGPRGQAPQPKFSSLRRILGESFEIENVDLKTAEVDPAKVPLLLIVRPRDFTDVETYRLDQYLMKGGRVILFVSQGEISQSPWAPNLSWQPAKTGLDEWLAHMGLRIPQEFVLHYQTANPVQVEVDIGGLKGRTTVPSWFRPMIVAEDSFDKDNPAVQTLKQIAMFWAHPIDVLKDKLAPGVSSTVLVKSHAQESWRWKNLSKIDMRLVNARTDGPRESDLRASPVVVAKPKGPDVVKQSKKKGYLVAVGNAIFISDDVLGGQDRQVGDHAREATLLAFNLVDWLARSEDLIALRAKRFTNRQIVDEELEDEIKEAREKAGKGDMTRDQFLQAMDEANDKLKARRQQTGRKNLWIPVGLIVALGALVGIGRAGLRGRDPRIPAAKPPASLADHAKPKERS